MDEFSFSQRFLQDLTEWEHAASSKDKEAFEKILAALVKNPAQPGRAPSFYDPQNPSYLYRAGAVLIHFRIVNNQVEFLNLFYRKA